MNAIKMSSTLQKGFEYLLHQQSVPGLWIGTISPLPYATAVCVIVLNRLNREDLLEKGIQWLRRKREEEMDDFNRTATDLALAEIENASREPLSEFKDLEIHSMYPFLHFLVSDPLAEPLDLKQYKGILGTVPLAYALKESVHAGPERVKAVLAYLKTLQDESGGFFEDIPGTACIALSLEQVKGQFCADELLEKSIDFIKSTQHSDGGWPPFPDLRTYDTALALDVLVEIKSIGKVESRLFQEGAKQLLALQHSSGGWPWSVSGEVDLDDTSLAVDILIRLGEEPSQYEKSIQLLLKSQKISGGWSAFGPQTAEVDTTCHVATALYRMFGVNDAVTKGMEWVVSQQTREGYWEAKWYESHIIGTSTAIATLRLAEDTYREAIDRGVSFLIGRQNQDGGWGMRVSTPEETASALIALSSYTEMLDEHHTSINMGIQWLERSQKPSGLWKPSIIGRFITGSPYLYGDSVYVQSRCLRALTEVALQAG